MRDVSGVLVTRGDHDVRRILDSWPFEDIQLWDNSYMEDLSVYGRYAAMAKAENDLIFVQDDDCLVPVQDLLDRYEGTMLLNIPPGEKPLVGWGAVMERDQAFAALDRYRAFYPADGIFFRCADVIVTALNQWEMVDLGHDDLPWADGPDRMFRTEGFYAEREKVAERCLTLAR